MSGSAPNVPMVLTGVAPATLQAWLGQAQQALQDLTIGGKPRTVQYSNGDGMKSVTYAPTDAKASATILSSRISSSARITLRAKSFIRIASAACISSDSAAVIRTITRRA